ncbi:unnamed protein product [Penicillium bialowiezense]
MSSRQYIPIPYSLSLSEIIDLEPEEEPWCAGYAPSQRRRCHARTNAYGRSSAMKLLEKGTERLRAGRSLDTLLEDLAPYVLCTRWHQNQASTLSSRWKREVRAYRDSQIPSRSYTQSTITARFPSVPSTPSTTTIRALPTPSTASTTTTMLSFIPSTPSTRTTTLSPTPSTVSARTTRLSYVQSTPSTVTRALSPTPSAASTRTARLSSIQISRETPEVESPERAAILRKLRETLEELRQLEATEANQQNNASALGRRDTESSSRTASPEINESAPGRPTSQDSYIGRVVERGSTESTVIQMVTAVPRVSQSEVSPTRATPASREASASPSTVVSISESTLSRVNRHKVEGTCGICLCDMHVPRQEVETADAEETDNDSGDDNEAEDAESAEDTDDIDGAEDADADDRGEELTWCKARCGVNFHKGCIDQWLARARTCPTLEQI